MEDNIIVLEDENGNEVTFEVIDVFDFNQTRYFAMLEVVPDGEETDEVLIMKVEEGDNDEDLSLVMIEDEEELEAAFNEFLRRDEEME
ncbi:MAG: DUF1292 domain-containing protein [Clostridia bacterium]|nr:DUF1292 domain-containing protein [Clostridia bacterium]